MTVVERVARGMYVATMPNGGQSYAGFDADLDWACNADTYRQLARAAIQAMMEPTEEMQIAAMDELRRQGYVPGPTCPPPYPGGIFSAMLQVALEESEG